MLFATLNLISLESFLISIIRLIDRIIDITHRNKDYARPEFSPVCLAEGDSEIEKVSLGENFRGEMDDRLEAYILIEKRGSKWAKEFDSELKTRGDFRRWGLLDGRGAQGREDH